MLLLKDIRKTYDAGGTEIHALDGVSLAFRSSEFVSVLGPSGCGKTTLLNIIGGLDRYTSGDLVINGRSTKEYRDRDWDTYRNHSVGFVFQSYNLIPHQTVLANVELALTLSGVSKTERRRRAADALRRVGLGDQLKKRPSQMSGGQMQRVAIARALVNDPDILLADEPTGALDSATSVQVMELLKEVSADRLVVMVTHNAELAEHYSTRIVKLLDGKIVGDTDPWDGQTEPKKALKATDAGKGKRSMSFFTALSLSFQNLMTKRTRTLLTSFAGSIGIIGIALILALSTGVQSYIDGVQRDTLSSYPITIYEEESGLSSLISTMSNRGSGGGDREMHETDAVYSNPQMYSMFNTFFAADSSSNNLTAFKRFLDTEMSPETSTTGLYNYASVIHYSYGVDINAYVIGQEGEYISCDIADAFSSYKSASGSSSSDTLYSMLSTNMSAISLWTELTPGAGGSLVADSVKSDYELVYGQWPSNADEVVLILDKNNEVSDLAFYALGLVPTDEVMGIISAAVNGKELDVESRRLDYADVCATAFKLLLNTDYYADADGDGVWSEITDDAELEMRVKSGIELHISGIVKTDSPSSGMSAAFGYTTALSEQIISAINDTELAKAQSAPENANTDLLTGLPFLSGEVIDPTDEYKAETVKAYFASLTDEQKKDLYIKILSYIDDDTLAAAVDSLIAPYDTREKITALVTETFGMDAETAESYLSAYTDEELFALMRERFEQAVRAQYESAAEEQVNEIMTAPTDEELEPLISRINAQLTTKQAKIAFVLSDWSASTSMDAQSIQSYLASLSDAELDSAADAVVRRKAEESYAQLSGSYADGQNAKAAAAFDRDYGSETDTAKLAEYYDKYMPSSVSGSSLSDNLDKLGVVSLDSPSEISIYAVSFEDKDNISDIIQGYNDAAAEEDKINYTDYIALLMSGITDIINAITYGLITFVAISLVVSSIMIGIITYISVLERTKEIGILRSIGASKRDVSLVFNAETLIVGFTAGALGIIISLLLCIPLSLIIHALSGINTINAFLRPEHCVYLVLISMVLTLIAGIIPSRIASKKDPVEALRSE